MTEGGANDLRYFKTTEEEDKATKLETVSRLPASSAGIRRSETKKNGVHIRGLLLYAGFAAHGGAYFLRYLARKYKPRRQELMTAALLPGGDE